MITTDIFFTIMVFLLGVCIGRKSGDWMKSETDQKPEKSGDWMKSETNQNPRKTREIR